MEITQDSILSGNIQIYQPKNGYRVAVDPIILASTIELKDNASILDVGCGIGTISLILKYFNRTTDITCIDIDSTMIDLCKKNAELNNLSLNIINQSIESNVFKNQSFDIIVTNPPFYNPQNFRTSTSKFTANFETLSLETWINLCLKRLKPKGDFYIIHIAEQLNTILTVLSNKTGKIEIIPIYSYKNKPAKRIIIKCKKGSKEPLKIMPGIITHIENQKYSEQLNQILSGNF